MAYEKYNRSDSIQRGDIVSGSGYRAAAENWSQVGRSANQMSNQFYQEGLQEAEAAGRREGEKAVWVDPETNKPEVVGTLPEGSRPYAEAYRKAAEGRYSSELGVSAMSKAAELSMQDPNPESFRNSWAGYMKGVTEDLPDGIKTGAGVLLKEMGAKKYYQLQNEDFERTKAQAKVGTFNLLDGMERDTVDTLRNSGLAGGSPEFINQRLELANGLLKDQVSKGILSPQEADQRIDDYRFRLVRGAISGEAIKMAKLGKAADVDKFLEDFRQKPTDMVDDFQRNTISDYARGEIATYLAQEKTKKNLVIQAAKKQANDFKTVAWKGEQYPVDDNEMMRVAQTTEDPEVIADVQAAMAARTTMKQFSVLPPQEQLSAINQEKANSAQTPDTIRLRENLEGIYNDTYSAMKSGDTLQLAGKRGIVQVDPIDPSNPDSMKKRADDIAHTDEWMGTQSNPLLPPEKEQFIRLFDGMDSEGKIALYNSMKSGLGGEVALRAMRQMGQERPAMAFAMGISDDSPEVARTILMGDLALKADKSLLGEGGSYQDVFREHIGTALQGDDTFRDAVYNSALAYYAEMVKRDPSITSRSEAAAGSDDFQKAIDAVVGGVAEYNGLKTIVPKRGMNSDDFEELVESIDDNKLRLISGGKKMVTSTGKEVSADLVQGRGMFEWSGDGSYILRMKIGTNPHGLTVFQADENGQVIKDRWGRPIPAELNLKALVGGQ